MAQRSIMVFSRADHLEHKLFFSILVLNKLNYKGMGFNWTCPHCNTRTTINDDNYQGGENVFAKENSEGEKKLEFDWIVCPNKECRKVSLSITYGTAKYDKYIGGWIYKSDPKTMSLMPSSFAKSYPDYIPKPLKDDYEEACAILELSPKASATLSRRCLQGIIRDFWKIKKGRLVDEINALEDKIDSLTWKSIDAVRKVGNIGAHMEKDINLIIEVDPKEAKLLIELIEMLFEEWYIHRHERELKLKAISAIAEDKDKQKKTKDTDQTK